MTGDLSALAVDAAPSDAFVDFCLWDYEPLAPVAGRWRSETILLQSFALAGVLEEGRALIGLIRDAVGPFKSVWGIKEFDGRMSWELYFYDYDRLDRRRAIHTVLDAIAPRHTSNLRLPEDRPYFMFSLSFAAEDLKTAAPLHEVDVYIGNPGSTVSSGICYLLTKTGMRLKNFYFFFDTETERPAAMRKLTTAAHFGEGQVWPAALAWPEMMACKTVVVANKAENDALYFSRVTVDRLLWFLEKVDFPAPLRAEIAAHRERYAHLYFDTGYDFTFKLDKPQIVKSSFYGYF